MKSYCTPKINTLLYAICILIKSKTKEPKKRESLEKKNIATEIKKSQRQFQ